MHCVFILLNYHFSKNNLLIRFQKIKYLFFEGTYFLFSMAFVGYSPTFDTGPDPDPGKLYGSGGSGGSGSATLVIDLHEPTVHL